jgi:hypothetical protein
MPESNLIRAALLSDEKGVAKGFNNKATGGISLQDSVNVCILCYSELLLRRISLGKTPSDLIVLFPSLNFQRFQGLSLMQKIQEIRNKLEQYYSYHNPNLNERIRFTDVRNITTQILQKEAYKISVELSPDRFIEAFKFESGENTKKKDIEKIEGYLDENWDSVENFNAEFALNYDSLKKVAEDILNRKCPIPIHEANSVIEGAGINAVQYSFVFETPNFMIISLPVSFKFNDDEADVNILLKRLLFASYLFLLTDSAVMVIPAKEVIYIPQSKKTIYIQPNATLKQVIKDNWISLTNIEMWAKAISAAVKLAYEGDYSDRSGIFEVLTESTTGHILSRINSKKKRITSKHIGYLETLIKTEVLKNERATITQV